MFCTRLYELTFGFFRIALRLNVLDEEDQRYTDDNHEDRPELRGGNSRNELASVVTAKELDTESEDSVGDDVDAHIILEVKLQKQEEHHAEDDEEESRLIKLGGMNGRRKSRELNAEEGIGLLTIAAAREEASKSAERVRDSDAAGRDRKQVNNSAAKLVSRKKVYQKEGSDTTDKTADECHSSGKIEACRRILDIVVYSLEYRRCEESDSDSTDTGKEGEIKEALANAKLLSQESKSYKRAENSDSDHKSVHIHVELKLTDVKGNYRIW